MLRFGILLLFALTVPLAAQETDKKDKGKSQSRIEKRTYDFKEAKKDMEYALFVPTGYDKDKKSPLIVALHGLGSNPQQIMRYRGLTDLAEKHGYIVVAPMGYNSSGWYGAKVPFKTGKDKDAPANVSELSEKDVMNVLALARKEFTIDDNRIYLMGHSMGGGGTVHIALKNPNLFAALAPIAPALFGRPGELEKIKHVPIILIQGDKDDRVKVERVRPWADMMKKLEMKHEYIEVPGGDHITIAFSKMPDIFAFFNKHKKESK